MSRRVADDDIDVFGAEDAAACLARRLEQVRAGTAARAGDGRELLSPPWEPPLEQVDGPRSARASLVVFGAHGTPASRTLAKVLARANATSPRWRSSWRHYPDPVAHPRAVILALATEAAAVRGSFWALTRELLYTRTTTIPPTSMRPRTRAGRHDPRRGGARDLPAQRSLRHLAGVRAVLRGVQRSARASRPDARAHVRGTSADGLHDRLTDFARPGQRGVLLRAPSLNALNDLAGPG
jgi:hypothetical protein